MYILEIEILRSSLESEMLTYHSSVQGKLNIHTQ